MPKDFIYETSVTVGHEDGIMLVDTTVAGVASQLVRCVFIETTRPDSKPYRRFRGLPEQIRFLKPKSQRQITLRGAAKKAVEMASGGTSQAEISTISQEQG